MDSTLKQTTGFVDEMRTVAMRLHTRDQSKEGERESGKSLVPSMASWKPTIEGYIKFLVDSKLVFDALERIVDKAAFPCYLELRNTGLERSERLARDLKWLEQNIDKFIIYEPSSSSPGNSYAQYIVEISEKDPQAFLCHFYNMYFGHCAGGRIIGTKVATMIFDGRKLEFYKWDGHVSQLLRNVRDKINKIAESWTREEKDRCLEETEKSFAFFEKIISLILS